MLVFLRFLAPLIASLALLIGFDAAVTNQVFLQTDFVEAGTQAFLDDPAAREDFAEEQVDRWLALEETKTTILAPLSAEQQDRLRDAALLATETPEFDEAMLDVDRQVGESFNGTDDPTLILDLQPSLDAIIPDLRTEDQFVARRIRSDSLLIEVPAEGIELWREGREITINLIFGALLIFVVSLAVNCGAWKSIPKAVLSTSRYANVFASLQFVVIWGLVRALRNQAVKDGELAATAIIDFSWSKVKIWFIGLIVVTAIPSVIAIIRGRNAGPDEPTGLPSYSYDPSRPDSKSFASGDGI